MAFLAWLENSGFATWLRESPSLLAYTLFLALHTIGLAFLVGLNTAVGLRILGVARGLPLAPLAKFFPVMFVGFWLNALTGVVLLTTAPTTFLRSPVFYVKLAAIVVAVVCLRQIRSRVFGDLSTVDSRPVATNAKILAAASLAFWGIAIIAGRLTAYSKPVVLATIGACLVVLILAVAAGYGWKVVVNRRVPSRQRV